MCLSRFVLSDAFLLLPSFGDPTAKATDSYLVALIKEIRIYGELRDILPRRFLGLNLYLWVYLSI